MDDMIMIMWLWILIANIYNANNKIKQALICLAGAGCFLIFYILKSFLEVLV